MVKRCHFSDLARLDRSDPPQTSAKSTPKRICQKVMIFKNFSKKTKLQKHTFAFLHTCTRDIAVLRAQKRQSASWALWSTLALPNRPSRTFAYVYEGFGCSESPKCTFGALGLFRAVQIAMRFRWVGGQTDGELGSRDGLPYGGPGSHSQPRPPLKGPWPIHIPCAGLQAFPPHSNIVIGGMHYEISCHRGNAL